jgi:hypothetical protein
MFHRWLGLIGLYEGLTFNVGISIAWNLYISSHDLTSAAQNDKVDNHSDNGYQLYRYCTGLNLGATNRINKRQAQKRWISTALSDNQSSAYVDGAAAKTQMKRKTVKFRRV